MSSSASTWQRPELIRFATILTSRTWLVEDLSSDVLGRAFERGDRTSTTAEPHAYARRMVHFAVSRWTQSVEIHAFDIFHVEIYHTVEGGSIEYIAKDDYCKVPYI